jgi:phage-related protein
LYQAQIGLKHRDAKPMKGLGSGVLEIVADARTDTYRAVFVVRFEKAIYVLHAFQKKAKSGIATAKPDIDLIKRRLRTAEQHHHSAMAKEKRNEGEEPHEGRKRVGKRFCRLGIAGR